MLLLQKIVPCYMWFFWRLRFVFHLFFKCHLWKNSSLIIFYCIDRSWPFLTFFNGFNPIYMDSWYWLLVWTRKMCKVVAHMITMTYTAQIDKSENNKKLLYALKKSMLPCFGFFLYPKNKGEIPKTMPDNHWNVVHHLYWRPVQLLIRHQFWDLRNNPINVAWQLSWVEMLDSLLSGIFLGSQKQSQKWCQIIIRQFFFRLSGMIFGISCLFLEFKTHFALKKTHTHIWTKLSLYFMPKNTAFRCNL